MSANVRVTWVVNSMGYDNKLLYWAPLLRGFVGGFPLTSILTCGTEARITGTKRQVKKAISCAELKVFNRVISVPWPSLFVTLAKTKPKVVVVSEFGLLSLYAVIYRVLNPGVRMLLLVENDPAYLRNTCVDRNRGIYRIVRRMIVAAADKILCNNSRTASYLTTALAASEKKVMCGCYLTSAVADGQAPAASVDVGKLSLLFVGRLIPSKGLIHLLRAMSTLGVVGRSMLRLEIVGDGPERRAIAEAVKEMGLEDVITLHGARQYEALGEHFSRADVFVFPTLGDYRALVGFEALSAGLPVIGSIFDGAGGEVVDIGVNGFLVDPRDEADLAAKIQYFLSNPKAVRDFSLASKQKAKKFSVEAAVGNLLQACLACAHDYQIGNEP